MSTTNLVLPEGSSRILSQCVPLSHEGAKFLVYTLPNLIPANGVEEVCTKAMRTYAENEVHAPEEEWDESTFVQPASAQRRSAGPGVQHILDDHVKMLDGIVNGDGSRAADPDALERERIYPFGFVVVEDANWRKHGVTVVYCEGTDAGWTVDECGMDVEDLVGRCQDLVLVEEEWASIKESSGRPTARGKAIDT